MKLWITIGWVGVAAFLVAATLAPVGGAGTVKAKPKPIVFTANYSGQANVQNNGSVANISASGKGSGTLLGAGTITGTGTANSSVQPCVPFSGPGSMSGPGGKLTFTVPSGAQGCGDEAGEVFSIVGHASVTKGTGKLANAKGTLRFTGVYDRSAGTFSVKLTGTLSH